MSIVFKSLEITMVTYAIFGVIIALILCKSKGKPVASAGSASATTDFDDDDDYGF